MALRDITVYGPLQFSEAPAFKCLTEAAAPTIYPGDPVMKLLGNSYVTAMSTNNPVVETCYLAGIATTTSTQAARANGEVYVQPIEQGVVYKIKANSAAAIDTQAEYDALVGKRVLIDLTAGTYTILTADGDNNGCVIVPSNIKENPGYILFTFRDSCLYTA